MFVLPPLVALLITALGTPMLRRLAARRGLLDTPNDRSSHVVPTPRLGGVGIALGAIAAWAMVARMRGDAAVVLAIGCGSSAAALIGLADDLRHLRPLEKLAGEIVAVSIAIWLWPGGWPRALTAVVVGLWIVTYANFFNFMDGSDGLAAAVTVTGALGLALLAAQVHAVTIEWLAITTAAAAAGFLVYNRPPATIFMGDSGSLFLGFVLATLAAAACAQGVAVPAAALVLSPFIIDAGFTLFRRAVNGERLWRAHRSHLYQRLIRAGDSHLRVLLAYALWSAFATALAFKWSGAGASGRTTIVLFAALPVAALTLRVRRRERPASAPA
jgi:Fuc2NAc and GlcNAc transferase